MATATPTPEKSTVTEEFRRVPIDAIYQGSNVRAAEGDVTELAESIKAVGILQPLIVTSLPKGHEYPGYLLVAGFRRLKAAKLAKLDSVPVMVRTFTDPERVEAQLIENLQRKDIEPVEEGKAMQQLLDLGRTKEQLAKRIGRTTELVSQRLALLGLPKPALDALDSHKITIEDAIHLTKIAERPDAVDAVLKEKKTYRNLEVNDLVRQAQQAITRDEKIKAANAELASAKIKNVGLVRHWGSQLKGDAMKLGQAYQEVNVRRDVHEKLPCHVAGIDEETGDIVYGCSKPDTHAAKAAAQKLSKKELEKRAEVRTENKLRKDAKDQREEFTASLVKKATAARAAAQFTLRMLIDRMGSTEIKPAAQLLGLQPIKHRYGYESYSEPLEALADKGDSDLYRVALAIAVAMGEGSFSVYGGPVARKIQYLTFLRDQGYKLTPWEKEQLQQAKDDLAKHRRGE